MTVSVEVDGLRELRAEFKRVSADAPKELTKVMRAGAQKVQQRTVAIAPRSDRDGPHLAEGYKVYARAKEAGVVNDRPHAGVFEFGDSWQRRRGGKVHTVSFQNLGPAPRLMYKVGAELAPVIANDLERAMTAMIRRTGWLVVGG